MEHDYKCLLMVLAIVFSACSKKPIEKPFQLNSLTKRTDEPLLADQFKHLRIEKMEPVLLKKSHKGFKDLIDRHKLSEVIHLRDSSWGGGSGSTSFYESNEMVVTPSNLSYVYPGSILKAASIASDEFQTFFGYERAPVSVQLSFPSSLSMGTLPSPSLSNSRFFLRNALMAPDFSGRYIDDFSQTVSYFSNYEEVKLAYGYNVNERRLFSSTNSSFDYNSSTSNYATKLMASYTAKNFTYTMLEPVQGELINMATIPLDVFEGVSPVYVNSITYGRFGLLVVETNNSASQMKSVFQKVVKKIFKQTAQSFTMEETSLFSSCRVTIYLLGSTMGESVIQLLINPDPEAISNFMSENIGVFTAQDPGVPISFTTRYLKDNLPFKTVFKLNFTKY